MAIDQNRILALVAAGEDALRGLASAEAAVIRERQLVAAGTATAGEALENLGLFLRLDLLLERPLETQLAIKSERVHFSPARLGANRRARARRARKATQGRSESEGDDNDN